MKFVPNRFAINGVKFGPLEVNEVWSLDSEVIQVIQVKESTPGHFGTNVLHL